MKYIVLPFLFILAMILCGCSYVPFWNGEEEKVEVKEETTSFFPSFTKKK